MERRPALKVVPDHPELRAERDDEYEAQLSEGLAVLERLAGHPGNTPPLAPSR